MTTEARPAKAQHNEPPVPLQRTAGPPLVLHTRCQLCPPAERSINARALDGGAALVEVCAVPHASPPIPRQHGDVDIKQHRHRPELRLTRPLALVLVHGDGEPVEAAARLERARALEALKLRLEVGAQPLDDPAAAAERCP